MEPTLCIEADIRGLSNGRAWKIRNSQNRRADFLRMLERGLDFSRHLQEVDGDQDILAVHKRELLQERSPAGEKNPMGILFYAHESKVEQIRERHGGVEPYDEYFAGSPDDLDALVKIRQRNRPEGFLQELNIALDEFGDDVFIVADLGKRLLHAVRRAQLLAHF